MMNFNEFLEAAKDRVQETIPDADVKIQQVNKLQGESYTGISVQPEGAAAAVTFNVSPAFERYQQEEAQIEAILGKIASDARQVSSAIPAFTLSDITDYSTAKDHLVMQVVPVGPNKEMLENIPHKTVEDIAVVYRVELPNADDSSATTLVTNQLLAEYGVSADQLHADAVAAQIANHPPVLRNMSEVMAEMSGGLFDMPESPMWVATVDDGVNGAAVTQLPSFLEEAADRLGGDFFVLPSSVHEVLFIRDDGSFEREQLESMVRGVNATEVSEALTILLEAWGGAFDSLRAESVSALCEFVDLYEGEYDRKRLIRRFRGYDPINIFRKGRAMGDNMPGYKKYLYQVWAMYNGTSVKAALPLKF